MLHVVIFTDNPAKSEERKNNLSAHLQFLTDLNGRVKSAGPLIDPVSKNATGGIWIVEADNSQDVERLVRQDPLFATGLRQSFQIHCWNPVFGDFTSDSTR